MPQTEVNISPLTIFVFSCIYIQIRVFCVEILVRNTSQDTIENMTWIQWYVLEKSNSNGPLNHGGKGKTMYYVIQCRFSEFLFSIVHKKTLFIGAEHIYYCVLFWSPCRNISDQEPGGAGVSCRTIFGVCGRNINFSGNAKYPEVPLCTQKYLNELRSTQKNLKGRFLDISAIDRRNSSLNKNIPKFKMGH